jgi:cbb3-type cytochrome oxidase subunit 3
MFERAFIHLPPSVLPLIGLALFFAVFVAVCVRLYAFGRKAEFQDTAALPLTDDTTSSRMQS